MKPIPIHPLDLFALTNVPGHEVITDLANNNIFWIDGIPYYQSADAPRKYADYLNLSSFEIDVPTETITRIDFRR